MFDKNYTTIEGEYDVLSKYKLVTMATKYWMLGAIIFQRHIKNILIYLLRNK